MRQIPFERLCGRLEPVEQLGLLAPEGFGILQGARVHLAVVVERTDVRALAEFFRRRDGAFVENMRIEFLHFGLLPPRRWNASDRGPLSQGGHRLYLARTTLLNLVAKVKGTRIACQRCRLCRFFGFMGLPIVVLSPR